jgi:hypothetical protein
MNSLKYLIVIGLCWYGYQWWNDKNVAEAEAKLTSPTGFISVLMPDGARPNTVIILAPQNCPSDAAQRADSLATRLTKAGIPNTRSDSFAANIAEPTKDQQAAVKRAVNILNGGVPAVFVNGMAKANPNFDEVVAEYQRTKS